MTHAKLVGKPLPTRDTLYCAGFLPNVASQQAQLQVCQREFGSEVGMFGQCDRLREVAQGGIGVSAANRADAQGAVDHEALRLSFKWKQSFITVGGLLPVPSA